MGEVQDEYSKAKAEKRQPNCPHCGYPLTICQTMYEFIRWEWDKKESKFFKADEDGDIDEPYCLNCEIKTWDFVDFNLVDY